jgi:hypothetical protein
MSYIRIDYQILNSTIWVGTDSDTKALWLFLLLAADYKTGIVAHTLPAVARDSGIDRARVEEILDFLATPDRDSRSKDFEGRRIEYVIPGHKNGGIRILNYEKYRDKYSDSTDRARDYYARNPGQRHRRRDEEQQGATDGQRGNVAPSKGNAGATKGNGGNLPLKEREEEEKESNKEKEEEEKESTPPPEKEKENAHAINARAREGLPNEPISASETVEAPSEAITIVALPKKTEPDRTSEDAKALADETGDLETIAGYIVKASKHFTGVVETWTVFTHHPELHALRKWALTQGADDWTDPICDSLEAFYRSNDKYVVEAGRPLRMWSKDPSKWLRKAQSRKREVRCAT